MKRRPATQHDIRNYRFVCDFLQELVTEKLGRPLTPDEVRVIRNAGSLSSLEQIGQQMVVAPGEHIPGLLAHLARDGSRAYAQRLQGLGQQLSAWLNRPLTDQERHRLRALPDIEAIMRLEVLVAEDRDREGRLQHALAQLAGP